MRYLSEEAVTADLSNNKGNYQQKYLAKEPIDNASWKIQQEIQLKAEMSMNRENEQLIYLTAASMQSLNI
jgi:hypothetical protein